MKRAILALSVALLGGLLPTGEAVAVTAHQATLPGVTLLPPVARGPSPIAPIDPDVAMGIEIFALASDTAVGSPIGPSYSTGRTGKQRIRLHHATDMRTDHYHANWGTRQSKLRNGAQVRVEIRLPSAATGPACNSGVSLEDGCLAFFDVQLRKKKKGNAPDGMVGFQNRRTLPIRIHIADGALDPAPPDDPGDDESITELKGDPASPATAAIPEMDFQSDPDDYAPHAGMGGQVVSFNVLYLAFKLNVSVADANSLLDEIGAEIIGGRPGKAGEFVGFLLVRVPTESHSDMDALIDRLNLDPRVLVAVQDSLLETTELPKAGPGPAAWSWGNPGGDNWGLEAIHAPQMWNLNEFVEKQGQTNAVGVLDGGFYDHRDLSFDTKLTPLGGDRVDHGTHVAGTIAAIYDNEYGVQGVDPFARLTIDAYDTNKGGWGLYEFLEEAPDLQVVNLSLGNNWYQKSPMTNAQAVEAMDMIKGQAVIFELWQIQFQAKGRRLPLIVAAAGNDSNSQAIPYDLGAEWNAPWTYAAIKDGVDNVIVVEAVRLQGDGSMQRAFFSNIRGQIAAPGYDICSTTTPKKRDLSSWPVGSCGGEADIEPEPFMLDSGTSMAAPHVAGLAGYLSSLDPTLTPQELRKLLIDNGVPATGTPSPVIDAFASAMAIDGLRNNSAVLRGLLDIDDGTVDGNLRLDCSTTCSDFTEDDFDLDRGRGDGSIDMSDFRRWRDWFLLATEADGLELDGNPSNPKNDVNRDAMFSTGGFENAYPAGDFNGDGKLDEHATKKVPGYLNMEAADLGVLQSLFNDPDVPATRLPNLIRSIDLHVDPTGCFGDGVVGVQTKIFESADMYWVDDRFDQTPATHEYTMPYREGGYTVRLEALDSQAVTIGVAQASFDSPLGSDSWFTPVRCGAVSLSPKQVSVTLNAGESTTTTVRMANTGLDMLWEFTTGVANVQTSVTHGAIAHGEDVAIDVTTTCPSTPRGYGGLLWLAFKDGAGKLIDEAVPEYLPVDIVCLKGGVELSQETVTLMGRPGSTVQGTITLTNNGTALKYVAVAAEGASIVEGAEGDLEKLGTQTITVTAECPEDPGETTSSLELTFKRADGKAVTVDVPSTVPIAIRCLWTAPFRWVDVRHTNNVSLTYPSQQVGHLTTWNSTLGVATVIAEQDNVVVGNKEFIWDGIGDSNDFSNITLSASHDFAEEDPRFGIVRSRTGTSNTHFEAVITGPVPTMTITGGYAQSYTQSSQTTYQNDMIASGTNFTFELVEAAELTAEWTCEGSCHIEIRRDCAFCGWVLVSNSAGTFTGTMGPGRYVFETSNTLPTGANALSIVRSESYSLMFKFAEHE